MSTATEASLREVILDALNDAYYGRRAEIEGCQVCVKQPAGICADHQGDNASALEYEEARKQLERQPEHPEVLAVFCGIGAARVSGQEGGEGS